MGLGLYFTYTRSAPPALGLGALAMGLFFTGRLRREFLLAILVLAAGFFWFTDMRGNRYDRGFTDDQSGASRLVLWQAGIKTAMDNPLLGVGHRDFEVVSLEYSSSIDPYYLELQNAGQALGKEKVHNDFLNVWLSFGTPAFLLFLFLLGAVFWNFIEAFRQAGSPFLKALSLGCAGTVVAYAVASFLHNVMDSSGQLFILAGLSLALTRLACRGSSVSERG
jgi:O-antigen ligase